MTEVEAPFHGIDISHHQSPATLPWEQIQASSQFVIVRATYGTTADRETVSHVAKARALGLKVGLYHFFRPSQPWQAQLDAFLRVAEAARYGPGDLVPAVDIELDPLPAPGAAPDPSWNGPLSALTAALAQRFGSALLYFSPSAWTSLGKPEWLRSYPLWIAQWKKAQEPRWPPVEPKLPDGLDWTLHQYGVGLYEAQGGLQDPMASGAIDHNRARSLPLISGDRAPAPNPGSAEPLRLQTAGPSSGGAWLLFALGGAALWILTQRKR